MAAVVGFRPPRRPTATASGCSIEAGLLLGCLRSAIRGEVVEVARKASPGHNHVIRPATAYLDGHRPSAANGI